MAHGGPNLCHKNSEGTRPQILFAGLSLPPGLGAERDPLTPRASFPALPFFLHTSQVGPRAESWASPCLSLGAACRNGGFPVTLLSPASGWGPQRSNLGTRAPQHMWCFLCKKRDASPTLGGNLSPTSLSLPAAPQRQRTCRDLKSLVALGGDTDRPTVQAMTWVCSCLKRMEESLLPG